MLNTQLIMPTKKCGSLFDSKIVVPVVTNYWLCTIWCLAEMSAPAFHSSLTIEQSDQLEMIQKKAFAIILGSDYKSYSNARNILNQELLSTRRVQLCSKFALKCLKNPKHADLFPLRRNYFTRQTTKLQEINCKTARYYNSAVPYLTRMLNQLI